MRFSDILTFEINITNSYYLIDIFKYTGGSRFGKIYKMM